MQILLIIKLLVHALALLVLVRFLAQFWRVDRYNPVVSRIDSYSAWLCAPLRRILPWNPRIDFASLLVSWALLLLWLLGVMYLLGYFNYLYLTPLWALLLWFNLLLQLYFFLLLGLVVVSWIAAGSNHPLVILLYEFTEPLSYPIRRLIPSFMGLDFSPMVLFFIIFFLRKFVLLPLMQSTGLPMLLTIWI